MTAQSAAKRNSQNCDSPLKINPGQLLNATSHRRTNLRLNRDRFPVCFRRAVAVAVPRVHDLRPEELPGGEALRARLVHRQSAGTPPSGSRTQDHDRLLAAALPRALPRRARFPVPVSIVTRAQNYVSPFYIVWNRPIARFPPTCFSICSIADTTPVEVRGRTGPRARARALLVIFVANRYAEGTPARVAFEERTLQCVFQLLDSWTS